MEIFLEFLFDFYCELAALAIPGKGKGKGVKILASCLIAVVALGLLCLFYFGVDLLQNGHTATGVLCIAGAVVIALAQLIAGLCFSGKSE